MAFSKAPKYRSHGSRTLLLSVGCVLLSAVGVLLVVASVIEARAQAEWAAMQQPREIVLPDPGPFFGVGVVMEASWYGKAYTGRITSSGERFDHRAMTCAHRTLPFGTVLRVERAGRYVDVRVTDRGPESWTGKDIDLSEAAAEELGMKELGVARVLVRRALR